MVRVLVVEPDRQIRNFIAAILADFGHYVWQCGDAADARQRLRRARFDVLATDLVLAEDAGDLPPWARRVPVLTLSGRPFRPVADKHRRPPSLHDSPFRFGDLQRLVAAIDAAGPEHSLAA